MFSAAAATFGVRRLDATFLQIANATADQQPQEESHCSLWLNCLDNFDALRVKGIYAPKRKQGESAHTSTMRAHVIRGAVYLLLLPTVFVVPLVLGQRGATNSTIVRNFPHE